MSQDIDKPQEHSVPPIIFISHHHREKGIALDLADDLTRAGYKPWCYEVNSVPGPSYVIQVLTAIQNSQAVIVLVSEHSMSSDEVDKEIKQAHRLRKPFFPVLLGFLHTDLPSKKPEWDFVFGTAVSMQVPIQGSPDLSEGVICGLEKLCILPKEDKDGSPARVIEIEYRLPTESLVGRNKILREAIKRLKTHSLAFVGIKGIGKSSVLIGSI